MTKRYEIRMRLRPTTFAIVYVEAFDIPSAKVKARNMFGGTVLSACAL